MYLSWSIKIKLKLKRALLIIACILVVAMSSCKDALRVSSSAYDRIAVDAAAEADPDLEEFIAPYRNRIKAEMDKNLSYNLHPMFKTDSPYNTAIGNMMADAVLELAAPIFESRYNKQIDAVLLNYGGIRAGIGKGPVTTRTAYQIMPFENMVVVAELDGKQVKEMIAYLSQSNKAHPIANMKLRFDDKAEVLDQYINGNAFDENQTYHVATSNYLVEGGDNMLFFLKANRVYDIDYKLRNLFIDYFVQQDTINYTSDDRLTKLK